MDGDPVFEADIDWDLTKPCDDCPFRRSTPYHQGVGHCLPEYVESIFAGRFAHTCHKTDARADSEQGKRYRGRVKHCAGALIMLLKTGHGLDLQMPMIRAIDSGKFDIARFARIAADDRECYSLIELLDFNAQEMAVERRRRRDPEPLKELRRGKVASGRKSRRAR